MKRWTERDQANLHALEKKRKEAQAQLADDIVKMVGGNTGETGWSAGAQDIIREFLCSEGQKAFDMLADHFELSPRIDRASPIRPGGDSSCD